MSRDHFGEREMPTRSGYCERRPILKEHVQGGDVRLLDCVASSLIQTHFSSASDSRFLLLTQVLLKHRKQET